MKKYLTYAVLVFLAIIAIFVLYKVFVTPKADQPIKIGFVGPLSGPVSESVGKATYNAIVLANERSSEISGRKVEVLYEDDACNPTKAVNAIRKLVDVDKVNIVMNTCSGSVMATAPITESKNVVQISSVATTPRITDAGDFVFRVSSSAVNTAKVAAPALVARNIKKVAIVFENNEYTVGWKDSFVAEYEKLGGKVAILESFNSPDRSMRTQLTKVRAEKVDALLLLSLSPLSANTLLRESKEIGISAPIIGNETFSLSGVLEKGEAEGILVVDYVYDKNGKAFSEMANAYQKRFGDTVKEDFFTSAAYDMYGLLHKAISVCGGANSVCVRKELYKIQDYQGASGVISFDRNGDTMRQFTLKRVLDGKLVPPQ